MLKQSTMAPQDRQMILSNLLFALQLCLGFWQMCKLTPMGGVIQGFVSRFLLLPFGLSPAYAQLNMFPDQESLPLGLKNVFKKVYCYETHRAIGSLTGLFAAGEFKTEIKLRYLNVDYVLERRGENMLFVNGVLKYYITENIWRSLSHQMEKITFWDGNAVFIKGYRELFPPGATGGVMTLPEVLDNLILENHIINELAKWSLLPVNLSVSEENLLKFLNLVGLFLQTKQVQWVYPAFFTLTAAILEFDTWLREVLYSSINLLFCRSMRLVCNKLPHFPRILIYTLGCFVDNLRPSNDVEWKIVKGDIRVVMGGAARTHTLQGLVACADIEMSSFLQSEDNETVYYCETFSHPEHDIKMTAKFYRSQNKCFYYGVSSSAFSSQVSGDLPCTGMSDFVRICTFLSRLSSNSSGSLKIYDNNNVVHVYSILESISNYVESGFPPVYEMHIKNAIVM
ncbi:hypothetical protein O6H91_18G042400 [Diphasiastrum complanatum]|uniref:Uncharacterized protein n=1 Tax=Diphasiastrum complanatum TaxID=34168 RepID=A0ACC2B0D9_DIPCM|nr:hypothetical protein O6H91_18G042400 [Diphasiastrum complanatum]